MSDRAKEIQVGTAFLLAVAVLISGVMWFKEFRIGGDYHEIRVAFENTSGLLKGDAVEVSGVVSGNVTGIEYEDGLGVVRCRINRTIEFHQGTEFVIASMGIMGQKVVAITPGPREAPVLPNDTLFHGSFQPGIGGLMGGLGTTLDTVNRLAIRLEQSLDAFGDEEQAALSRSLANLDRVAADMAEVLEETRPVLTESVHNFNRAMESVHTTLDENRDDLEGALESANHALGRVDSSLTRLDDALAGIDRVVQRVESGEGTLGRLIEDEALYDELKDTLRETRLLLSDVKENPRKYLKLSIF